MKSLLIPFSKENPYQQELAEALEKRGVQVIKERRVNRRLPLLRSIRAFGKPDVIHLHWIHPFLIGSDRQESLQKAISFTAEFLAVKLLGIKVVWTIHNLLEHEKRDTQLELFFIRHLIRLCDQIIVHCSFAKTAVVRAYQLPDSFKDRINVIPHGHYIKSYKNQLTQAEARAKLDLGETEIVFLHLGQIRRYKGVFQLVNTFRELSNPQARLLIAGKPIPQSVEVELTENCELDDRIRVFPSFIPDEQIQLFMNAADVVVLPYQDVFTSGSALLAMSFSKAVIIPRRGCVSEVLDQQGGFLYNPDDQEGLLKAMQLALISDLAAMGQHNYYRAKYFDWDMIGQTTYEIYYRHIDGSTSKEFAAKDL